jgi:hypothetical protein
MIVTVRGHVTGGDPFHIALSAPPIEGCVTIEGLLPPTSQGHPEPVVVPGYGGEIAGADNDIPWVSALPEKAQNTLLAVVAVDPDKAGRFEILLEQGPLASEKGVEIPDPSLESLVRVVLEEMPLKARFVVPLRPLTEFASHEEELLAGVQIHITIEEPQICKLLPVVSGHFPDHGAFAMDDFIMGKRQDEVFTEGI